MLMLNWIISQSYRFKTPNQLLICSLFRREGGHLLTFAHLLMTKHQPVETVGGWRLSKDSPMKEIAWMITFTLPKTNSSHLKMGGWNTTFLLGMPIFRCYVRFQGGYHSFNLPRKVNPPTSSILFHPIESFVAIEKTRATLQWQLLWKPGRF